MSLIDERSFETETARVHQHVAKRPLRLRLYSILVVFDLLCVIAGFLGGALLRFGDVRASLWGGVATSVLALYLAAAIAFGAYTLDVLRSPSKGAARASGALSMAFLMLFLLFYLLKVDPQTSRMMTGASFFLALGAIVAVRQLIGDFILREHGSSFTTDLLLVDCPTDVPAGVTAISTAEFDLRPDREATMLIRFGHLAQGADRLVVACERRDAIEWSRMLRVSGVQGEILTREFSDLGPCGVADLGGRQTIVVSTGPMNTRQRALKRAFDIALTLPVLILLSPVFAAIALAIKLDSKGPILFRQPRVGRGNAMFDIYKFRSMDVARHDVFGSLSASRDDDRVTPVGRFLRRTSLDELPQLINVLLGSMSIVGPRPHALGSTAGDELFWHIDDRYWDRHVLKPGITGLAQVRGLRGATQTKEQLTSRLCSDLEYVNGWSIWRDLEIILRTAFVLVHPQAY